MATQNRAPTGDGTVTGTVSGSAGSRWTLVDDYPDASTSDMLTFGTAASTINFTFSVFSFPADSKNISVQVRYVDGEAGNGANNCGGRLVINGSNFNATTHNPAGTAGTQRSDNWATNPSSGAAWTVDEINGIGTHGLDGFGINSSDSNPTFNVRSIEIQVTYDPPVEGTLSATLAAMSLAAEGQLEVAGALSASLAAMSLAATGEVVDAGDPPVEGTLSATLAAMSLSAAAAVDVQGTLATSQAPMSLDATGTVEDPASPIEGTLTATLAAMSLDATAHVGSPPEEKTLHWSLGRSYNRYRRRF